MSKQDAIYVDDLYDENVALRAEIEVLRLGLKVGDQRYAELAAENERLRAALDGHHVRGFGCAISTCKTLGEPHD